MHMKDKSHCMMNKDYFSEIEQFYDFSDYNNEKVKRIISKIEEKIDLEVISQLILSGKDPRNRL